MQMRWLAWLVAAVVLALSQGCVIGRHYDGRPIDGEAVSRIEAGSTTRQGVLEILGPPRALSRVQLSELAERVIAQAQAEADELSIVLDPALFDEAYVYEYHQENEAFFTLIVYTYFMRDHKSDQLLILFDQQDRVSHVAFARGTADIASW